MRLGRTRRRISARKPISTELHRVKWLNEYANSYARALPIASYDTKTKEFYDGLPLMHADIDAESSDQSVDDLIRELTGVDNYLGRAKPSPSKRLRKSWLGGTDSQSYFNNGVLVQRQGLLRNLLKRRVGGEFQLEPKFSVDYFQGAHCLDVGCGSGRWTRALIALGATVKSIDISETALASTRRFNNDAERLDLFDILDMRPELHDAFDLTICRELLTRTHDPLTAFRNVACTVKPGGDLYLVLYASTTHCDPYVLDARHRFHIDLTTNEERLNYIYHLAGNDRINAVNYQRLVGAQYKWILDEETIRGWCDKYGFSLPQFLNATVRHKFSHHVLIHKP